MLFIHIKTYLTSFFASRDNTFDGPRSIWSDIDDIPHFRHFKKLVLVALESSRLACHSLRRSDKHYDGNPSNRLA